MKVVDISFYFGIVVVILTFITMVCFVCGRIYIGIRKKSLRI